MGLYKNYELEACRNNVAKALAENELGRNKWLEEFVHLLDKSEDIKSIAIDGDWGNGKTFLLKKLEYILEKATETTLPFQTTDMEINLEHDYRVIYYNCWRHDNGTDIAQDIITSIMAKYDEVIGKLSQKNIDTVANLGMDVGSEFSGAQPMYNLQYKSALEVGNTHQAQKIKVQLMVDATKNRENRRDDIKNVIASINKSEGRNKRKQRVVIIVDGVDRCRPEHALKVLEDVKHFMMVEGVTVIYGVNLPELKHVVAKTHGEKFNGRAYISKFFDYKIEVEVTDEMRDAILSGECGYLRDLGVDNKLVEIAEFTNRAFAKAANRSLRGMEKSKLELRLAFKKVLENKANLSEDEIIIEIMNASFEILCEDIITTDKNTMFNNHIVKLYDEAAISVDIKNDLKNKLK